jgi:hypothetical protein
MSNVGSVRATFRGDSMRRAHTLFLTAILSPIVVCVTAWAAPLEARDFNTKLPWRGSCPQTREEIAQLTQCVQCPRENDTYLTKVCCPPNDRFTGALGGCLITADEIACRLVKDEQARRRCYELLVPIGSGDPLPISPPGSGQVPGLPPTFSDTPPEQPFNRCLRSCQLVQRYLPWDLLGCQNACLAYGSNQGGCAGLKEYCKSLSIGFFSCQRLYNELCGPSADSVRN